MTQIKKTPKKQQTNNKKKMNWLETRKRTREEQPVNRGSRSVPTEVKSKFRVSRDHREGVFPKDTGG